MKNVICFEGEWLYNSQPKENRFDLNTELVMRLLKEFHKCDTVYRHILSKEDLKYYMDYFNRNKREWNKIHIVYIVCHGWNHSISLEGEDGNVDLSALAEMAGNFFQGKIVHFGCCKTLANEKAVIEFKEKTGAKLVCGYQVSVDAMKSAIADTALLNELITLKQPGNIKNEDRSKFRKTYKSLLDELKFKAI